jgi:hypothetical protein
MERKEDLGGYDWKLPIITATNTRASWGTISGPVNASSNTKVSAFILSYCNLYSVASWGGPVLKASEGNKNAFEQVVSMETDMAIAALNMRLAAAIYRTGTGSVSQVSPTANVSLASGYLKLLNQQDINMFEVGDSIAASATDGRSYPLRYCFRNWRRPKYGQYYSIRNSRWCGRYSFKLADKLNCWRLPLQKRSRCG